MGLASAGSDPASASVSVEWLRSHETFVMARLTWRTGSGATAQGPVLEISVNDRMIAGPDADTFGRHLADSLPAEDF